MPKRRYRGYKRRLGSKSTVSWLLGSLGLSEERSLILRAPMLKWTALIELKCPAMQPAEQSESTGNTHFQMRIGGGCDFKVLHIEKSHEERQGGFSSLIFIDAIWMQPV